MAKINKSKGVTASERYLAKLCELAFLSPWSYPNLYASEGIQKNGTGKELCDLLVTFDEHVLIFSDKDIAFSDAEDIEVKWRRWAKRAIINAARQVYGAEKWITEKPNQIFLDNKCTRILPVTLPPASHAIFHRIVVTKNSSKIFRQYVGGSGTLMIRPDVVGDAHLSTPFTVGQVNPQRGFVHVFDDVSLGLILHELDTITDFVEYLVEKEKFIRSGSLLMAAGEEELLAYFLRNLKDNKHYFDVPAGTTDITLGEGLWSELASLPQYKEGKRRDKVSYLWDALIEHFSKHTLDGTLEIGSPTRFEDNVVALQVMARENRICRRILGKNLEEKYKATPPNKSAVRVFPSPMQEGVGYVLLLLPKPEDVDYKEYREFRMRLLRAYADSFKVKCSELNIFVGIAHEPRGVGGSSEDLMYFDATSWSEEDYENARKNREEFGLLLDENIKTFKGKEFQFPIIDELSKRASSKSQKKAQNKRKQRRKIERKSRKRNRRR